MVQKGVFGESVSSLLPLRFALATHENLKEAERKRTLQKPPFWTTVSPHDAFAAPLERSEELPNRNCFGINLGRTPTGRATNTLLRRVPRRFSRLLSRRF